VFKLATDMLTRGTTEPPNDIIRSGGAISRQNTQKLSKRRETLSEQITNDRRLRNAKAVRDEIEVIDNLRGKGERHTFHVGHESLLSIT
tara:strand:+ start:639 stop:905 length:267 start_codon:yes stop_codon:yes gene_type:complete